MTSSEEDSFEQIASKMFTACLLWQYLKIHEWHSIVPGAVDRE